MSNKCFKSGLLLIVILFVFITKSTENDINKTSVDINEDIYVSCDLRTTSDNRVKSGKDGQNLCKVECYTKLNNPGLCQIHSFNPCKTLDQMSEHIKCPSNTAQNSLFQSICCPFKREIKQNITNSVTNSTNSITNSVNKFECGKRPNIAAIVGGIDAQPNTWPWVVSIYEKQTPRSEPRFICGGAIISHHFILSAAHCFVRHGSGGARVPPNRFLVKVGAHRLSDSIKFKEISEIIPHKKYSSVQHYYDIALIRVRKKIEFLPTVAPICLPTLQIFNHNQFVGHKAKLVGWGATRFGSAVSNTLKEVDVNVVDSTECNRNYSAINGHESGFPDGINGQLICAGVKGGGKDSCQGDSGGPLGVNIDDKWYELGIVSFGYKCAEPGFPGIYTRVKHFMDWIQLYIK